jgi:RNA polymerase sigma factor (sigma-70 family)
MPNTSPIHHTVDHLFRHQSGKMVAVLSRLLGLQHLDAAQDIVQDTLLQAMYTWSFKGLPENPDAWLMKAAKNKAVDFLRRQKKFTEILPQYARLVQSEYTLTPIVNNLFLENEIADSQLRMMFACCHPAIPTESQVALILKTLCGLSVSEIARAFLTNDDTITKRIYRAKEKIKQENIALEVPQGTLLVAKLDTVLQALYLLFNEGYNSSHPDQLIREDLCSEAMRLCYLLTTQQYIAYPRVKALLSLMCFQSSRLHARLDDKGNIVLLQFQDRSTWYQPLIQKGFDYLNDMVEPFEQSTYHLEAAIASIHAAASSFETTDWKKLLMLYRLLAQMNPSPMVLLNYAIVLSKTDSVPVAIEQIHAIPNLNKLIEKHYLFAATLGELHNQLNDYAIAKQYYEKAIILTNSEVEKKLLSGKMATIHM